MSPIPPVPQHTHVHQQQQYLVKNHSQRLHLAPYTLPLHLPCQPCLSSNKSLPSSEKPSRSTAIHLQLPVLANTFPLALSEFHHQGRRTGPHDAILSWPDRLQGAAAGTLLLALPQRPPVLPLNKRDTQTRRSLFSFMKEILILAP